MSPGLAASSVKKPWGLHWRSSHWYVTFVVGLGLLVDLMVYTIIIPVLPFRLQNLGYDGVSGLTGWLLFAYSAALVVSTLPIAAISEKYANRQYLLVLGQLILIGAQIMLMEARTYWLMVIARVLQGTSSSMIWILGLALLCDTTSEDIQGRQLGIAASGFSLGAFIGPPVGGALFGKFGIRGPFIFSIIITAFDFFIRCLIIERKNAILYGVDPAAPPKSSTVEDAVQFEEDMPKDNTVLSDSPSDQNRTTEIAGTPPSLEATALRDAPLSLYGVLKVFLKSLRAVATIYNTLIYGISYTSQEPALPLYLAATYGLNSSKVGLVLLAGVIPTLISSPVSGWISDTKGAEWVSIVATIVGIPWWGLITIKVPLSVFIVFYAILNFCLAAIVAPLTAELAMIARSHRGIGYAHVYGAFNMAFGLGSSVGPIIGGQLYQHISRGWLAINLLAVGLLSTSIVMAFCFTGNTPLREQLVLHLRRRKSGIDSDPPAEFGTIAVQNSRTPPAIPSQ